jgi:hypothetical protein
MPAARVGIEFYCYHARNVVFDPLLKLKCVMEVPGEVQAMKEDFSVIVLATINDDGEFLPCDDEESRPFDAFKVYPIESKSFEL